MGRAQQPGPHISVISTIHFGMGLGEGGGGGGDWEVHIVNTITVLSPTCQGIGHKDTNILELLVSRIYLIAT